MIKIPAGTVLPRLTVQFRPQKWGNDYAIDIEGACDFDCTDAFLFSLALEEIITFEDHSYMADNLAHTSNVGVDHTGPFEVDVDPDHLEEFFNWHGLKRAELTEADLVRLRHLYKNVESPRD